MSADPENGKKTEASYDFFLQGLTAPWQAWTDSAPNSLSLAPLAPFAQQAAAYVIDATQRTILMMDVLRQRGNAHFEQEAKVNPNVLHFAYDVVLCGRDLPHPVNYDLLRIKAPDGAVTDPTKRPFIVIDPRAGQGPGIGGMKQDSEIGIALRAGHPCYFIGFLPAPVEGQTIEHVCEAEALFVAHVRTQHPDADKPCVIGNCQAGWQVAMMNALHPDDTGVLILAGAPLSFWAGVRGKNPMRYFGGLTGGSWMTALSNDLGHGIFDGAALVEGFENLNPANTLWQKNYHLYAAIDSEAPRFLEFEKWWGSPTLLNAGEMQYIVDELFIGNKLSMGRMHTSDGLRIDLRNITAPIVVFCSHGDDITPPQQALGWITDLYSCDDEIVARQQTIVYSLHNSVGHLGIFVAGAVATKEHDKFVNNIDLIEDLPPGLYETVFIPKTPTTLNADLANGQFILRFERRTLADIRALGSNDLEDDRRFAALSRLSENLEGLYHTIASPIVKSLVTEESASWSRRLHPARLRFEIFSDKNPFVQPFGVLADKVRDNRQPVSPDNPFWILQEQISTQVAQALDFYKDLRDTFVEQSFLKFYGNPLLQASLGLLTVRAYQPERAGRDPEREREIYDNLNDLRDAIEDGGPVEALIRALIYIGMGSGGIDEREFAMLRNLRNQSHFFPPVSHAQFRAMIRQQYLMLVLDTERAIDTIPLLLARCDDREIMWAEAMQIIHAVLNAQGPLSEDAAKHLRRIEPLLSPTTDINLRRRRSDRPRRNRSKA